MGVGEKTAAALHRLGLRTIADVAHTPVEVLQRAMGPRVGARLHALAWGDDDRRIVAKRGADEPEHSIGADETFGRDTDDADVVLRELLRLSAKVAARMRAAHVSGRTITVRVRFSDFTTITRSRTLGNFTSVTPEIYATAADLFAGLGLQRARIRLVGVRVEGYATQPWRRGSCGWTSDPSVGRRPKRAVDRAVHRFGRYAVRPATLLEPSLEPSGQSQAP